MKTINPYHVARILLLGAALAIGLGMSYVKAQTITATTRPTTLNIGGYPGNTAIVTLVFSGTETVPSVTDVVRYSLTKALVPTDYQQYVRAKKTVLARSRHDYQNG